MANAGASCLLIAPSGISPGTVTSLVHRAGGLNLVTARSSPSRRRRDRRHVRAAGTMAAIAGSWSAWPVRAPVESASSSPNGARSITDLRDPAEAASASPGGPSRLAGRPPPWSDRVVTATLLTVPLAALVLAGALLWRHGIDWLDVGLGSAFYLGTGFGIVLGYHRLLTHRSFRARRGLRIALAVAGSFAVQGSPISWVAHHRRHHRYADQLGDPHSPWTVNPGRFGHLRGFAHAHVGWLFSATSTDPRHWCRDLLDERDMVVISALAPLWAALSLALPFAIGLAITRSLTGALSALLWAGVVRIALLHHATWSINSLARMFGARPHATSDHSGNLAWLALISLGDSWHNTHHAFPALARHGCARRQLDPAAALLSVFDRLGWVSQVRWPVPDHPSRRVAR